MTQHADRIARRVDAIVAEMGDDRFFTNKEVKALPDVLAPDEDLLSFCSGMLNGTTWLAALTDRRVVLLDKGMFWGLKQTAVDLTKINSVSRRNGLIMAKITISDGAQSYEIDMVSKKHAEIFVARVEARLAEMRSGRGGADDRLSRLERLAALRASGAIDDAEFQAEKARII